MKKVVIIGVWLLAYAFAQARDISLEECINLAVEKSIYTKQKNIYESVNTLKKLNYSAAYMPQFKLEANANYQSDVFAFPLKFPGITIPEVEKLQYQASLNIYQNIYEGGMVSAGKEAEDAELEANITSIKVNNHKIKEIISELYFNALMITENIKLSNSYIFTIETKQKQIQALINNGVMLKSAYNQLEIEKLKIYQKIKALEQDKQTLLGMLAKWIEDESIKNANLIQPIIENTNKEINRPEFEFFSKKAIVLDKRSNLIKSQIMPNLSAFLKAGYGSPNPFNFFESDFSPFYMLGVKFQWNVWDWSVNSRNREELNANKELISLERENFDKNLQNQLLKETNDIVKYQNIINKDMELIELQKSIVEQFNSQVNNGTVTMSDFISESNNLHQLEINHEIHKLQLLNAKYNHKLKLGN